MASTGKHWKLSEESKRKISLAKIGVPLSEFHKQKLRKKHKKFSNEIKEKLKKIRKRGENHWAWKGGQTEKERMWQKNQRNRVIKRLQSGGFGHTYGEWEILKTQYGFTCPACKKKEPDIKLSEDHIIPLSKGGSDLIENIQPLCRSCNCKKWTKIIKYNLVDIIS